MKRSTFRGNGVKAKTNETLAAPMQTGNIPRHLLYSRAFEAVIWGMPAVNYERMFQAFIHDVNGSMNEVVYWSRISDWKNQTLTPNPDFINLLPFFDTKEVGPIVLEIPANVEALIDGSINDCWQGNLAELGHADHHNIGEAYLILPPGYNGNIPDGYIPLMSQYYQGYALLRVGVHSNYKDDVADVLSYAEQIKLYPLSKAGNPAPTIFTDAADIVFDATIHYDLRFFQALNRVVQYEPWLSRDKVMIDILKTIGIERGRLFKPDLRTQEILDEAARDAQAWFSASFEASFFPHYEGRQWMKFSRSETIGSTGLSFEDSDFYAVDQRALLFYCGHPSANQMSTEYFSLLTVRDKAAELLDGSNEYRLQIPNSAPVRKHWSVTVYDRNTHAFIKNVSRAYLSSHNSPLHKNNNGSVDIYFSPERPDGKESNWIPTQPHENFEICMRFYGPEEQLLDKRWKIPDVERVG